MARKLMVLSGQQDQLPVTVMVLAALAHAVAMEPTVGVVDASFTVVLPTSITFGEQN